MNQESKSVKYEYNDILGSILGRIQIQYRITFFTGLFVGCITHLFMLTNKLPNWDDITNMDGTGSGSFLGRWFLRYIHSLGGDANAPATHGFLMILLLSLSACIVVRILELKNLSSLVITASVMVTFPSVACIMSFMFMAHTSALAILMNCFAVYCLRRWKYGFIGAICLIVCSLAIYQSYVSIAIALILMGMIIDCIHEKEGKQVALTGIKSAVTLIISVPIYMLISYIYYPGIFDSEYGGVGEMGQMTPTEMLIQAGRAYKRFIEYFVFKPLAFVSPTMRVTNTLICVAAIVLFVLIIIRKRLWKDRLNLVVFCLSCFFMPMAVAFVYFMAPKVPYSMLMLYAYCFVYVLVAALLENLPKSNVKEDDLSKVSYLCSCVLSVAVITVLLINCYTGYLITNKAYYRSYVAYERVVNYYNRLIAEVEKTDGYKYGDSVFIGGDFYYVDDPAPIEMDFEDSENLRSLDGISFENGMITAGVRKEFVETYIGFPMGSFSFEDEEKIVNSSEYKKMPVYPEKGCVKRIDDVWVIKIN